MNPIEYTAARIDEVVDAARRAFETWAPSDGAARAGLLRALADQLDAQQEPLAQLADAETALGLARLRGEIARTSFQLRGFAAEAERGGPYAVVDDAAVAGTPPQGRPRLVRVRVPLGVVAVFSASNFPFAFSVLGGDTAAALAAGCAVVVKAHPGHPALSRRVLEIAAAVLAQRGLPPGLIGMVEGAAPSVGVHLVRHPQVAAVAFTGSVSGGLALQAEAQRRPRPIPFFGELGSVNPVVVLPAALEPPALPALAEQLAQSIGMGCGQFCTSPGIVIMRAGAAAAEFERALTQAMSRQVLHPMLTAAIRQAFDAAVARRAQDGRLQVLLHAPRGPGEPPAAFLARIAARDFLAAPDLHEEVFGPAALLVLAEDADQIDEVLRAIGGSLTVTLWGADTADGLEPLVAAAMQVAGRVLFKGVPTGVAICAAQQHGGPYPSSTEPATTSVGFAALDRFLRPVALQEPPSWLVERRGLPLAAGSGIGAAADATG